MRKRGLGYDGRVDELKKCCRDPPDLNAHIQSVIDK